MKNVTAILTADIGLQENSPVCRLDSYWEAQARKIKWLSDLQKKYNCPILDGGDLFEHWKASPFLLQWALQNLPDGINTIPGNHDLPAHSIDLYDKSGLAVLEAAGKIEVLIDAPSGLPMENNKVLAHPFPWGSELLPLDKKYIRNDVVNVALVHAMTYIGRSFPGCKDPHALSLLKQMSGYQLIIIGHNHSQFTIEKDGRKLISPGSLARTTADQADYKPCVFLWDAETNELKAMPVPIEEGVISREHTDAIERKDERLDAFVSRLSGEMEIGLSFSDNLGQYFSTHRVRQGVKDIVWESTES